LTSSAPRRDLSPLPLGEAGRRPGEGAFDDATKNTVSPASTLTPALSQRERERERVLERVDTDSGSDHDLLSHKKVNAENE
jgi:hypothetical protein